MCEPLPFPSSSPAGTPIHTGEAWGPVPGASELSGREPHGEALAQGPRGRSGGLAPLLISGDEPHWLPNGLNVLAEF